MSNRHTAVQHGPRDLVALTEGPVGAARQEVLTGLHRELDRGVAKGLDLGGA